MGYLAGLHQRADDHNKERILELANPVRDAHLVDLGCGRGTFTTQLAARVGAAKTTGVEFVPSLAREATALGIDAICHDLNTPLPFEGDSFDVVHSNQVIEHLTATDLFLREVRRILKPSGYAILSTNNLASWHNVVMLALGMQPLPCHISDEFPAGNPFDLHRGSVRVRGSSHYRVFSFRGFRELLRLHGFEVDRLVTTGYYPFPSRVADRLCRIDPLHGAFLVARLRRDPEVQP